MKIWSQKKTYALSENLVYKIIIIFIIINIEMLRHKHLILSKWCQSRHLASILQLEKYIRFLKKYLKCMWEKTVFFQWSSDENLFKQFSYICIWRVVFINITEKFWNLGKCFRGNCKETDTLTLQIFSSFDKCTHPKPGPKNKIK